jgi:uncharacterized protein YhhL (DUF1145 family)
MKIKIKKLVVLLVTSSLLLALLVYFDSYEKNSYITAITIFVTVLFKDQIILLYSKLKDVFFVNNWKNSQKELEKKGDLKDDTKIRISFAYLFRIKIDDMYFLVPNKRSKKYQPVGGAYKFYKNEADYLSENIPAESDDCIPVDEITKRDYRLIIENKNLRAFIKRFNSTLDRENIENLSREFKEEIFISGILNSEEFGDLIYRYCGRHMTNIEESVFGKFEILLADIVEVRLTENQEVLFRSLMDNNSVDYKFATAKEIKALGVKAGSQHLEDNIANHTYKILIENSDKLTNKNEYKSLIQVPL